MKVLIHVFIVLLYKFEPVINSFLSVISKHLVLFLMFSRWFLYPTMSVFFEVSLKKAFYIMLAFFRVFMRQKHQALIEHFSGVPPIIFFI